jgi:hypothetical protein
MMPWSAELDGAAAAARAPLALPKLPVPITRPSWMSLVGSGAPASVLEPAQLLGSSGSSGSSTTSMSALLEKLPAWTLRVATGRLPSFLRFPPSSVLLLDASSSCAAASWCLRWSHGGAGPKHDSIVLESTWMDGGQWWLSRSRSDLRHLASGCCPAVAPLTCRPCQAPVIARNLSGGLPNGKKGLSFPAPVSKCRRARPANERRSSCDAICVGKGIRQARRLPPSAIARRLPEASFAKSGAARAVRRFP